MTKTSWDIHQCPLAKRCRARWEKLEPVPGDLAIRFCAACERSVYLCKTDEDLAKHSALGRCVALEVINVGIAHVGESLPIDRWSEGYLDAQPKRGPERKSGNDDLDPGQPMLEPDRSGG